MTSKRSKVITVTAAGALTVATALTAVAAFPSASAAAPASAAGAFLTSDNAHVGAATAARAGSLGSAQQLLQAQQVRARFIKAEQRAYADAAAKAAAEAKAAAARKAAAEAKAAAARKAAASAAAQAAAKHVAQQQTPATTASGSPEQIAQAMLGQYGWPASQFSCLYPLWEHESGWNPSAMNPSSGAYGIPQALPGSQMVSAGSDWQTNPATQIKWGLSYIQSRYGSPCGAWAHEQADNWY